MTEPVASGEPTSESRDHGGNGSVAALSPFAEMPRTAGSHFVLGLYAAIFRLIHHVRRLTEAGGGSLEQVFESFPFLGEYFAEMRERMPDDLTWAEATDWWRDHLAAWEADAEEPLPLLRLEEHAALGFRGRLALLFTGLVEEDSRFGTLMAEIQQPLPHRRPTLELVGQVVSDGGAPGEADAWAVCRPLLDAGLLEAQQRETPRSEWALRVPPLVWDAVRGELPDRPAPGIRVRAPGELTELGDLLHPPEMLERLARLPALLASGQSRTVVLRSAPGADPEEVLGALARSLGLGLLTVCPGALEGSELERTLGPLCALAGAVPALWLDPGPGETVTPPELTGYRGPVGFALGLEGGLADSAAEHTTEGTVTLTLPSPRPALREACWRRVLGERPVADLPAIAAKHRLASGFIRQAAEIAVAHARLDGRDTVEPRDVQEAARALNRQLLDTLAQPLPAQGAWEDLVVGEGTRDKLEELERRCRHRERILDFLGRGFGASPNGGVRALFTGPSGTGKTLAARILAAELGMDLYRVDLAAVINKYIGETEKNLHKVLSRAEALDVVLLLDEGDALLGTRTEVRNANDRYANLETNYLLQRLETYEGIVLVTTNLGENIDSAFQRRMDVVVPFFAPRPEERRQILDLHLPADHLVEPELLERISVACALNGGQLRNAALHASLFAVSEGGGPVTGRHLEQAIRSEYRKAGAAYPLALGERPPAGRVEDFMTAFGPVGR
jgi:histone H3/H4